MTGSERDALVLDIDTQEKIMHDSEQFHTLEEQIADMKRRGLDPSKTYNKWDDDKDDWGNATWKENGKWEPKTEADLDEKARENWDGENGKANPPPIV